MNKRDQEVDMKFFFSLMGLCLIGLLAGIGLGRGVIWLAKWGCT